MKRSKVQINYKSGQSVVVTCTQFKVKWDGVGGIHRVEWADVKPNPLHIGINEIESIWEIL
jgi:hypothetical protein